ncbi:MAG TPA: hypothetical protein VE377_14115 [Candidatus Dormibacteraeota bacterium]|nr:hypothetical protein [Candidatus Dormibacteraeota bacterium]
MSGKFFLIPLMACIVAAATLSGAAISTAYAQSPSQQSQQPPTSISPPSADPSAALRNALAAACEENGDSFARFLTAPNAEAFARLAPERRVKLMQRLALLDAPGKPEAIATPSGRSVLRCTALGVISEMQFGGANVRDNLAFIPVEVRAVDDASGTPPRRVAFGLVREDGDWKLLSVGLLLIDLPALDQQWDLADAEENETSAIAALARIATSIRTYRDAWGHFPPSLASLGPAGKDGAGPDAANFLDAELSSGTAQGYSYRYVVLPAAGAQTQTRFEVSATPLVYGKSGRKSFLLDARGAIHGADRQGARASDTDPRVSQP